MKYYVLDENKNRVEAYDKEGVIALLEKAIADGSLEGLEEDTAFVSKIKSLTSGGAYHVDFVTQAKYNELEASGALVANCYYFITDDPTYDETIRYFENKFEQLADGDIIAGDALHANEADTAKVADRALATPLSNEEGEASVTLVENAHPILKSKGFKGDVPREVEDGEFYLVAVKVEGDELTKNTQTENSDVFFVMGIIPYNSEKNFLHSTYSRNNATGNMSTTTIEIRKGVVSVYRYSTDYGDGKIGQDIRCNGKVTAYFRKIT